MPSLQFATTWADRFRTVGELFQMLRGSGRWWAVPVFTIIILLSLVLAGLQAIPYVAPFIYTIF